MNETVKREKTLLSLRKSTLSQLEEMGFNLVEKPNNSLELESDITKLSDTNLGKKFQRSISWENYAGDRLALARVDELLADYNVELTILKAMRHTEGGVQNRKAEASMSLTVRKAKLELKDKQSMVIVLESQYSRFNRNSVLLSREQTRRASENRNGTR